MLALVESMARYIVGDALPVTFAELMLVMKTSSYTEEVLQPAITDLGKGWDLLHS
jgi:hypothetical protein